MKTTLIISFLIVTTNCFSQCTILYVNQFLGGIRVCPFNAGDFIEICESQRYVNGCGDKELYITEKGKKDANTTTYKLAVNGGRLGYMYLVINQLTKKFALTAQGTESYFSYYTESEMKSMIVAQEQLQMVENQRRDAERCILIDQLYIDKKIEEAKSEMVKLNFPEKYKNKKNIDEEYILFIKTKKDRETTEDINNINTIRILLKSNSIEKVVQAWVSLHDKRNLQNIKDSIFQFILKNETGNIPISLANSDLTKFIELNKVQIGNSYKSITKDTNIIIQFDQLGKCLQKESYTWNSSIFKKYSTDFFTYQTLQFPVSLKIIDTKIKNKAELPYAGTKKTLGLSRNGKIYKVNLLTVDIIGLTVWEKNYDKKLAKNEVRIEVFFTRNLFANEIPIDSKEILKSNNQKLNPRTLRVVGRGASIAAILGWFGLRIIENQTIK